MHVLKDETYTKHYIKRALESDEPLEEPDSSKANGTSEALMALFLAHKNNRSEGAINAWQTLLNMRPDLSQFYIEKLTINITELYKLPKPKHMSTKYPLYAGGFNVLVGESGSGKSFLALDIALDVSDDGTVVYVAGEGLNGFDDRWQSYSKHHGVSEARVEFYKYHALQVMDDNEMTVFVNGIRELNPSLVIIDTVARSAVGLDENSAKEMGLFISRVDFLRHELDCATMVVHHTNKAGIIRGSNSLYGAADAVIALSATDGVIKATNNHDFGGKNKYGPQDWTKFYRLLPIDEGAVLVETEQVIDDPSVDGNELSEVQEQILLAMNGYESGVGAVTIVRTTEIAQTTIYRNLKKLMSAGYIESDGKLYTITPAGKSALGVSDD